MIILPDILVEAIIRARDSEDKRVGVGAQLLASQRRASETPVRAMTE
jgi:hypothetical protein